MRCPLVELPQVLPRAFQVEDQHFYPGQILVQAGIVGVQRGRIIIIPNGIVKFPLRFRKSTTQAGHDRLLVNRTGLNPRQTEFDIGLRTQLQLTPDPRRPALETMRGIPRRLPRQPQRRMAFTGLAQQVHPYTQDLKQRPARLLQCRQRL